MRKYRLLILPLFVAVAALSRQSAAVEVFSASGPDAASITHEPVALSLIRRVQAFS